jgi:hypothetical protein
MVVLFQNLLSDFQIFFDSFPMQWNPKLICGKMGLQSLNFSNLISVFFFRHIRGFCRSVSGRYLRLLHAVHSGHYHLRGKNYVLNIILQNGKMAHSTYM